MKEMEELKTCTKCGTNQEHSHFWKDSYWCKTCFKTYERNKITNKNGLLKRIYRAQVKHAAVRKQEPPNYTQQEFIVWALQIPKFHKLFKRWKKYNYEKEKIPSFDRQDNKISYVFSNLKVTTFKNNRKNEMYNIKNGIDKTVQIKSVIGIHKITGEKKVFHSVSDAERKTGVSHTTISGCCNKKYGRKSAGGYTWKFKKFKYEES